MKWKEKMIKWNKIEDKLPQFGELVWVYAFDCQCLAYYMGNGEWIKLQSFDGIVPKDIVEFQKGITHWYPRPSGPNV